MTPQERKDLAVKLIRDIDGGDFESMAVHLTEDAEFQLMSRMPGAEGVKGKDAVVAQMQMFRVLVPAGFHFTFGTVIAEGEHVAIQAESNTVTANGRPYANRYHFYIRFEGDKIAEIREYSDTNLIRATFLE